VSWLGVPPEPTPETFAAHARQGGGLGERGRGRCCHRAASCAVSCWRLPWLTAVESERRPRLNNENCTGLAQIARLGPTL
jgi:hypothetical protein